LVTVAMAAAGAPGAVAGTSRGFSATLGARHASARFRLSYTGSGRYATTYTSEPPNKGGKPDHNSAHDTSTQSWSLTFSQALTVPQCGGNPSPCGRIRAPTVATGPTAATGRVDHTHIDGLFAFDNATIKCSLKASTKAHTAVPAEVQVGYLSSQKAISITALDPLVMVIDQLPTACPQQGDPTDGLLDSYFTPGFSFAENYGATRWFTSARVVIPLATIYRASLIRIPLGLTRRGTPPKRCAVPDPSYEHCSTGGTWSGVLTLRYQR
jgi:hypothetical protein